MQYCKKASKDKSNGHCPEWEICPSTQKFQFPHPRSASATNIFDFRLHTELLQNGPGSVHACLSKLNQVSLGDCGHADESALPFWHKKYLWQFSGSDTKDLSTWPKHSKSSAVIILTTSTTRKMKCAVKNYLHKPLIYYMKNWLIYLSSLIVIVTNVIKKATCLHGMPK